MDERHDTDDGYDDRILDAQIAAAEFSDADDESYVLDRHKGERAAMATTAIRTLAFLTSALPLSDGSHEREIPAEKVWSVARSLGLARSEYGRTWFVYESKAAYLAGLD